MLLWREKLPDTWLAKVRANLAPVLVDHAHLERKAATSALNLEKYVELHDRLSELNAIAIEELQHFELVLRLLRERGIPFTGPQRSPWIAGMMAAIRKGRELMATLPLKEMTGEEIAPGAHLTTDDEILEWVRNNAETTYHPVGTCKMGADPMAVVDDQLRVRGLAGLRVADASIMPTLTSGNTNAPSIMIGEKAARMMLASTDQAVAA